MKSLWSSRTLSEKRVLIILALVLSLAVIRYAVVVPLKQTIFQQKQTLKKLKEDQQWLDEQALIAGISPIVTDKTPTHLLIQNSVKTAGFVLTIAQEANNTIAISAETIPLPELIHWLQALRMKHGIYPIEMTFMASEKGADLINLQTLRLKKREVEK